MTRLTLTPAEAREVDELARTVVREYADLESHACLTDLRMIAHDLPLRLRREVNRARLDDRLHVLVISGNPVNDQELGDTPAHWRDVNTPEARVAGAVLLLEAALLGDAIGWTTQQEGRVLTDVLPIQGMEDSMVSSSSHAALAWHTEDSFSPYRSDYVGLFCLRSPFDAPTTVSTVDLTALPESVVRVLMEPRFLFTPDHSHGTHSGAPDVVRAAVLEGSLEAPVLRIDRDFTAAVPGDTEAERALEHIVAQLDNNLYDLHLGQGDIGFIDNRNVVHGRRPFRARYDGRDRWLRRVNIAVDLRRTRPGRAAADIRTIG
ncbi:guanitoxin biosynthesis L-enduracididine beta-hydroxylase GntD [Saccharomonospora azurea]|uniref:guanitoxin biosynthesis L-enduracididine beta-hydroxylase GntD n=1 Tax=Saccharomonospora azurea TaxID=40988 RepID=UPI00024000BF|nr:guanitoxin biosynthesis L-enduracididine beta-hydroxylase GntD [Saccharomonospora azurea]EHK89313.1 hypothetical protein SZMC14600_00455 [Saccharomonospora azurea SZMC 14600]